MDAIKRWMRENRWPLLAVTAAALMTVALQQVGKPAALAFFIVAVMVSALSSGWRPVLVATGLSAIILTALHFGQLEPPTPEATQAFLFRLAMFLLMGGLAAYLSHISARAGNTLDRVHDILSGYGDGLIFTDAEGRITYLNPAAEAATGWSLAVARDLPLEDVFRVLHGETRRPMIGLADAAVHGTSAAHAFGSETHTPGLVAGELPEDATLLSNVGATLPIEGKLAPLRDALGQATGVSVVFRDVSARRKLMVEMKQREEQLKLMLATAPAGMMFLDLEGRCGQINPVAREFVGCALEECQGQGWTRHLLPDERDEILTNLLAALQQQQCYYGEFRVQSAGATRWLRLRTTPLTVDRGAVLGHVAVLDDVSRQKRMETDFAEKLKEHADWRDNAERELRKAHEEFQRDLQEASRQHAQSAEALHKAKGELDRRVKELTAETQSLRASLTKAAEGSKLHAEETAALKRQRDEAAKKVREELQTQFEAEQLENHRAKRSVEEALTKAKQAEQTLRQELEQARAKCELLEADAEQWASRREEIEGQCAALERQNKTLTTRCEFVESLLEQCPDGLFAFDKECRYTAWSAAMERLTKKSKEDVIGQSAFEVFPALAEQDEWEHFVQAMGGKPVVKPASSPEWRETSYGPLRDGDTIIGGVGVIRKIPEESRRPAGKAARKPVVGSLRLDVEAPEKVDRSQYAVVGAADESDWLSYN